MEEEGEGGGERGEEGRGAYKCKWEGGMTFIQISMMHVHVHCTYT